MGKGALGVRGGQWGAQEGVIGSLMGVGGKTKGAWLHVEGRGYAEMGVATKEWAGLMSRWDIKGGVAMSDGGVATKERTTFISRQDCKGGVVIWKGAWLCQTGAWLLRNGRGLSVGRTTKGEWLCRKGAWLVQKSNVVMQKRAWSHKEAWLSRKKGVAPPVPVRDVDDVTGARPRPLRLPGQ